MCVCVFFFLALHALHRFLEKKILLPIETSTKQPRASERMSEGAVERTRSKKNTHRGRVFFVFAPHALCSF